MKLTHIAAVLAFGIAPCAAFAVPVCPAFGAATAGCDITITVGSGGTVIANGPSSGIAGGTYDGSEDSLVGIQNNLTTTLNSIDLSSSTDIFGFDGDGIDTFGAPGNSTDNSVANTNLGLQGYGGPITYFTNLNGSLTAGTVNFIGGLAPGASTYFSLEEALVPTQIVVVGQPGVSAVPEPSTLLMLGTGVVGFAGALRRKFAK